MKKILLGIVLTLLLTSCRDKHSLTSLFPLEHYDQTITDWIKPTDANYNRPLLSTDATQHRLTIFYQHYIGTASPWHTHYINHVLQGTNTDTIYTLEKEVLNFYDNKNKAKKEIGYNENFQAYTEKWLASLATNINIEQFSHLCNL